MLHPEFFGIPVNTRTQLSDLVIFFLYSESKTTLLSTFSQSINNQYLPIYNLKFRSDDVNQKFRIVFRQTILLHRIGNAFLILLVKT